MMASPRGFGARMIRRPVSASKSAPLPFAFRNTLYRRARRSGEFFFKRETSDLLTLLQTPLLFFRTCPRKHPFDLRRAVHVAPAAVHPQPEIRIAAHVHLEDVGAALGE